MYCKAGSAGGDGAWLGLAWLGASRLNPTALPCVGNYTAGLMDERASTAAEPAKAVRQLHWSMFAGASFGLTSVGAPAGRRPC